MYNGDPGYSPNYSWRTWLIFFAVVSVLIFACGASIYVGLDVTCYNDAQTWLPDYPDAELVSEEYTFVRAFGVGETDRILYTPDDERTVRDWYFDHDQANNATGARRDDGIGMMRWFVEPVESGGTQILLYSECSSDIVPW